jgi:hypothetical protein
VIVDAPKADVSVLGMNIYASASQDIVVEAKGQASIKSCGKLDISGTAITFSGGAGGGSLTAKGMVVPSGTGGFCAIGVCPLTGVPHSGETIELPPSGN